MEELLRCDDSRQSTPSPSPSKTQATVVYAPLDYTDEQYDFTRDGDTKCHPALGSAVESASRQSVFTFPAFALPNTTNPKKINISLSITIHISTRYTRYHHPITRNHPTPLPPNPAKKIYPAAHLPSSHPPNILSTPPHPVDFLPLPPLFMFSIPPPQTAATGLWSLLRRGAGMGVALSVGLGVGAQGLFGGVEGWKVVG